jgi:hypothetical protein
VAFVENSLENIDGLLAERQALLDGTLNAKAPPLVALQGRLLRHVRNELCYEFSTWSADSRATEWRENSFYAIDSTRNFTSSAAAILGLKGFTNSSCRGGSAITSLVANSLATLNPTIRDGVSLCMRKYQTHYLSKRFQQAKPRSLQQLMHDWEDLAQVVSGNIPDDYDKSSIETIALLTRSSQRFDDELAREEARIERLRRVAAQQTISGTLIGMLNLGRSITSTVAYYGYRSEPVVSNRISFAGRISQTAGQSYSLIATPAAVVARAIYQRRLSKKGTLPAQILQARLRRLDDLEAQLNAAPGYDLNRHD